MDSKNKIFKVSVIGGFIVLLGLMLVGEAARQEACVPPPSGLVSWWPGDGNANDIVDANHGTLMNNAMFAAGKVGQAFSLDGVDDYIDAGTSSTLDFSSAM